MAHADLDASGVRIAVDVPLREKPLIQQVPGARWHDESKRWRAPLSWATCKALRGVFGDYLTIGDDLAAWATAELESRIEPSLYWRGMALDPAQHVEGADPRLYPYQQTGVCFLYVAGSALLADEMGTGKTVQTSVAIRQIGASPVLVVCPKSMQRTWARELEKWADIPALVLEGSAVARRKQLAAFEGGAVIATYDLIRIHSRIAGYGSLALSPEDKTDKGLNELGFQVVVADEAHRAKEPKAKQTRALWALGDKAKHRFALTGTPVANTPEDLWSLMRFVSPDEWPSRTRFIDRYCSASFNVWGGLEVLGLDPNREPELREVLNPRFLRRPKALVLPHLPPKVYERRDVEMTPKQAKAYREMADGMVADLDAGEQLLAFDPLTQFGRLTQLAKASASVEDGKVTLCEPSSTLDALEEILDELGDETPCVVFASSRQLINLAGVRLTKRGETYVEVVGGMSTHDRQFAIDAYNDGRARIMLVSLGAGAEGMSLTRGSTEVFLDRSMSQVQNLQGEDRLHGTGRGDSEASRLLVIDLITRDSVDEFRHEALQEKSDRMEEVVRDRDLLRSALTHGRKEKGKK